MNRAFALVFISVIFFSCASEPPVSSNVSAGVIKNSIKDENTLTQIEEINKIYIDVSAALENAQTPADIKNRILEEVKSKPDFANEMKIILNQNKHLWILVDKKNPLDKNYVPQDLILLKSKNYSQNKDNQYLEKDAAASLEEMAQAAKKERLTLVVSSAYRSYSYQGEIYSQNVKLMGAQAADKVSARPGYSQHQLGTAVDFGSITNLFASTSEGRWIAANASGFGWSLSYPRNMEHITGYNWESWHFRYVGRQVSEFIDKYFEGIQQYALKFLHEYKK